MRWEQQGRLDSKTRSETAFLLETSSEAREQTGRLEIFIVCVTKKKLILNEIFGKLAFQIN